MLNSSGGGVCHDKAANLQDFAKEHRDRFEQGQFSRTDENSPHCGQKGGSPHENS